MRMTHLLLALATVILPLAPIVTATPAEAQASPCTGKVNIVRISDITPGKMDTFLKAIATQKAWYAKAGTKDVISVMRIMDQGADKSYKLSETQAITTHEQDASRGPNGGPAHDAGFDAFVALFKDSSTIKTQYIACVVK
jgi:predicted pyridoxine 5'-phosphate oxidase superfamily flavin-nucleotide-binding protein